MRFRKIFIFIILTIMLLSLCQFSYSAESVEITAECPSAILVERKTGNILYEKNAYEKKYPASTTKIMTAILALENCDLNEKATVSYDAIMTIPAGYVTANLQLGEELTIEQLLNVLLVYSANDAANVIAEHIAGSVESFATMMNTKAAELGCKNTHFVSPYGEHSENHYSSAYDLMLIGNYAMNNEIFRSIVSKTAYILYPTEKYNKERHFTTTNALLEKNSTYYYEKAIGIKTGYTTPAGNCLVAAASDNNLEYIVVLLDGAQNSKGLSERYLDAKKLFNFAFNHYEMHRIKSENDVVQKIEVANATNDSKELNLLLEKPITAFMAKKDTNSDILPNINLKENLEAPIAKGDIVGTVEYVVDGVSYSSNLIAASDVHRSYLTVFIILVIILIVLFYLYLKVQAKKRKKNYRKKRKK